ncbi:putative quinol monooxygenase [Salinibacterium sp. CAN_S4]|uniref:putative quinol monooxygenase n=1 Tax=Salinibacterium sp. CAN_S4 TaxID=2787727 RepID=UPI003FA793A1
MGLPLRGRPAQDTRWECAPGSPLRARGALLDLQRLSRLEHGCRKCDLALDSCNPDVMSILERFRCAADFEEHRQSAHCARSAVGEIFRMLTSRSANQWSVTESGPMDTLGPPLAGSTDRL